jgi:hypothetical protein
MDEGDDIRYDSVVLTANHLTDNNSVGNTTGIRSNAASFTAASNHSLSRANFVTPTTWSWSFWAAKTGATAFPTVISKQTGAFGYNSAVDIYWYTANTLGTNIGNAEGNDLVYNDGPSLDATTAHFYVITFDTDKKSREYVDGNLFHTSAALTGTPITAAATLYFGDSADTLTNLTGWIDEVGHWNRALTDTEVSDLYNSGAGLFY